jgi:S1-C subfamily serine protease
MSVEIADRCAPVLNGRFAQRSDRSQTRLICFGHVNGGFLRLTLLAAVASAAVVVASALALGRASSADAVTGSSPRAGVVVVETNLAFTGDAAAGTGIVLTSSGEVVTNNHVIRGATTIRVTDVSTRRSYAAHVVGYSVSKDVAVLKLVNAHGLTTATIGDSSNVFNGESVTAVGNAGGTGSLTVVTGRVTGLGQAITVSDDQGGSNRLTGMIETSAPLQPGDSGGPLLANGRVIGLDAAAGSSGYSGREGYAIPVNTVVSLAGQIEAGHKSSTVHVGPTAFLGVLLDSSSGQDVPGASVRDVVSGSAADRAGLGGGDTITGLAGRTITTPTSLQKAVLQLSPGKPVLLRWTDGYGYGRSATIRPAAGPPQ